EHAFARAAARRNLGAAMPAHVEKGPELSVLAAHHQQGYATQIVGAIVAGLGELAGEAEEQRMALEQDLALALGLVRACIGGDGIEIDRVRKLGGVAAHVVEHPARERDLRRVFHEPPPGQPHRRRCAGETNCWALPGLPSTMRACTLSGGLYGPCPTRYSGANK